MEIASRAGRKTLAGDASMLASAAVLVQGAGIVVAIVLARVLPVREFGRYQQVLLVYGIAAPLLFAGIPAALTYFIARSRSDEERRTHVFDALVGLFAVGWLFALLLVLFRTPLADALNGGPRLAVALGLLAPYALFSFVAAALPNTLIPIGRARLSAVLSGVSAAVYVACVISAAVAFGDVRAITLAMGISAGFGATLAVVVLGRAVGYRTRWSGLPGRAGGMLGYGLPLALTGIAGILGYQFDRIVVTAKFSPALFAVYTVGAIELPVSLIVQQSINSVLLPELAARHREGDLAGLTDLWREAIRKTSLILLPLFVLCMLFAGDLVKLFFGEKYAASVPIFRIYLLLMPIRVATYGLLPMALGRTRVNLGAAIVTLASNAVLALALVGPLGLKGPAWATVIATVLTVVYYFVRLRGMLGMSIATLFPWRAVITTAVVAAVAGIPVVPLLFLDLPHGVRLVVGGVLYATFAVAALRATKRLNDDDWRRLLTTIRVRSPGQAGAGG